MCGIIGIIHTNIFLQLIYSLKQLQNRGYDSAGIGSNSEKEFLIKKFASDCDETGICKLEKTQEYFKNITTGIGHTRWATHGAKTDYNSHPHMSYDKKFMLVHNGIIENFLKLKLFLEKKKIVFRSDTDTEVIVNLIAFHYEDIKNVSEAIEKTIRMLEGTWGLCIMCLNEKDTIYCTRKGSPLLVGINNNLGMIVSEQSAFCNKINNYIVLKNNDICCLTNNIKKKKIEMKTRFLNYLSKDIIICENVLTPDPYKHWTEREIFEQSESALRAISLGARILSNNSVKLGGLLPYQNIIMNLDNIILLGCGTSYYAGLYGIQFFKELCFFNTVNIFDGAEFDETCIPNIGSTGLILLSQSGETKDLHRCIEIGKNMNLFMIGVVNVVDSMISREVNCGCYLNAGREVGVASTKSFTSQAIVLSMIAIWISEKKNLNLHKRTKYIDNLRNLSTDISNLLNNLKDTINEYIYLFEDVSSCFILGKGQGEAIAKEAALKIKEICYIHAEGYSSSSLKHGPFALLCDKFPIILISPYDKYYSKNLNTYEELTSRGVNVLFITNYHKCDKKYVIYIPNNQTYNYLLSIIPIQLLAYKLSLKKKINPDMPKNLAKVVTVE